MSNAGCLTVVGERAGQYHPLEFAEFFAAIDAVDFAKEFAASPEGQGYDCITVLDQDGEYYDHFNPAEEG